MAKNLLRSGFPLIVHNRSRPPIDVLLKEGATSASTPREVGLKSDLVLLSLPSTEAVHKVVLGEEGIVHGMERGGVIIDTSTIDPKSTCEISHELESSQIHLLDAPVSGGPEGAQRATLTFMVGGNETIFKSCCDIFSVLGKNVNYMGGIGTGQGTKLVNQLLVAAHTLATAEAIRFTAALNLDLEKVVKVIKASAGDSFIFERAAPIMISRNFGCGWQTYLLYKDLQLIENACSTLGLRLKLPTQASKILSMALNRDLGKVDAASIIQVLDDSD